MKWARRKRVGKQGKRGRLLVEPLEHRLCLASSVGWDGPGTGAASLSYHIGDVPASVGLDQAQVESAIETALAAWSDAAAITFTPTSQAGLPNSLDIRFDSIDGTGGILAQAHLPDDVNRGRIAGDIQFDAAESWEIGNERGRSAFDLVRVAAHEIGHAIGLDHLHVAGSVLSPTVSPNQVFTELSAADVDAILRVYASSGTGEADATAGSDGIVESDDAGTGDDSSDNESDSNDEPNNRRRNRRPPFGRGRFASKQEARNPTGLCAFASDLSAVDIRDAAVEVLVATPSRHNAARPADVNGDNRVSPLDALMVIQQLAAGAKAQDAAGGEAGSVIMSDVNGDDLVTALDALQVIRALQRGDSLGDVGSADGRLIDHGALIPIEDGS